MNDSGGAPALRVRHLALLGLYRADLHEIELSIVRDSSAVGADYLFRFGLLLMETHLPLLGQAMLQPLVWWLLMMGGATFSGYPGAVLMTPLAWLALSIWTGVVYRLKAEVYGVRPQWNWAAIGGLILGLILGIMFAIVTWFWMPAEANRPDELEKTFGMIKFMVVTGCFACPLITMLSSMAKR